MCRNLVTIEMSVSLKNTNIIEFSNDRGAVVVANRNSFGVSFLLLLKKSLEIGDLSIGRSLFFLMSHSITKK